MHWAKKRLPKFLFLLILPWWVCSLLSVLQAQDFIDHQDPPLLRWDTRIPVDFTENSVRYVTLASGMSLSEVPSQISQRRAELGLNPTILLDQQGDFFENISWQIGRDSLVRSPFPGRITRINVQRGQQVQVGDHLLTIEAMKMEMMLRASSAGEIDSISIEEGDIMDTQSLLLRVLDWEEIPQPQLQNNRDILIALFPWAIDPRPSDSPPPMDVPPPDPEPSEPSPPIEIAPPVEFSNPVESTISIESSPTMEVASAEAPVTDLFENENEPEEILEENSHCSPSFSLKDTSHIPLTSLSPSDTTLQSEIPSLSPRKGVSLGLAPTFSSNDINLFSQHYSRSFYIKGRKFLGQKSREAHSLQVKPLPVVNHQTKVLKMSEKEGKYQALQEKTTLLKSSELFAHNPMKKFMEASDSSLTTWAKWLCALIFLCQLSFVLKTIGYTIWNRFLISKTIHLKAVDFNKESVMTHQSALNRNRIFSYSRFG